MAGLHVVMWNSGGLRAAALSTAQKLGFFDKEFPEANFSVAAFLETSHKDEDDFPDLINEYRTTITSLTHLHPRIISTVASCSG